MIENITNKIFNENCLDWMLKQPDNIIDLVITSPPYDKLRDYKSYTFDFEPIAKQLYRILKPGGVVVWVVGDQTVDGSESLTSFKQCIYFKDECGFCVHDTMIYEKHSPAFPSNNRYNQVFEYMFVLSKGKPKTVNLIRDHKNKWAGTTNWGVNTKRTVSGELKVTSDVKKPIKEIGTRNNIWRIVCSAGFGQPDWEAYNHPATFPIELPKDHIITWSNEGDLVYDCFMGSGTTALAAQELNRNYVGTEISKEYCELIQKRLNKYPEFNSKTRENVKKFII